MSRHCGFSDRLTAVSAGKLAMRWLLIPIFAVALSARAEDQSASTISREVKDIFDRCKKAVVKIHGDDEHSELSGTGFFIDPTGTIYTAYSVGGEAGAPLLNMKGEVVGIVAFTLENNSSCYALPIEAAEKIRSDFLRFGEVRHGWIGAKLMQALEGKGGSYAEVTEILDSTPAANSGIQPGDILLQVGNREIHQPDDIIDASFFLTAGEAVPITVIRGDEKMTFNIQADFHPASQRPPVIAQPSMNQALPLRLQKAPERTP